jgi:hypothetical protein
MEMSSRRATLGVRFLLIFTGTALQPALPYPMTVTSILRQGHPCIGGMQSGAGTGCEETYVTLTLMQWPCSSLRPRVQLQTNTLESISPRTYSLNL